MGNEGVRDMFFELGEGRGPDVVTSPEAFEKVREGLAGYVGSPVLIYKQECTDKFCGGDGIDVKYDSLASLGVLDSIPMLKDDHGPIVLPMSKYVSGIKTFGHYLLRKVGSIEFNCMNPELIRINDSSLGFEVSDKIYAGEEAVEGHFLKHNATTYFRAMNLLGEMPSAGFLEMYATEIESVRGKFLDELREVVRDSIGYGSNRKLSGNKEGLIRAIEEMGLGENYVLDWGNGISVDMTEFLESRG
jgi:hypothetical protein